MIKGKLKAVALALFLLSALTAKAISAYPGLQHFTQPDGTVLSYRLTGDEHCHGFVTEDGYLVAEDQRGAMCYVHVDAEGRRTLTGLVAHNAALRSPAETERLKLDATTFASVYSREAVAAPKVRRLQGGNFPTEGNLKGIILLVEFADNAMQKGNDSTLFHALMNDSATTVAGATGSARDYFIAQSMGKFIPDFDVAGPIKLSHGMAWYGANDGRGNDSKPDLMVKEACEYAHDHLGVDFSRYDFDNDGIVDFVYVIYAGYAESYGASSNTIWPHASNLTATGVDCRLDGKQIQRYACSSELKYVSGTQVEGIGTFCHEFGHVLGLPDMYNTFNQQSVQLGSWDIMDTGSYNNESHTPPAYSAFERSSLGWLELKEIDTPADSLTLEELTVHNVAYRISTASENEYFTLENRQQKGWDAYQPGRGLMIMHITYEPSAWNNNYVNAGTFPRYDLVEADGKQGSNSQTNLFPTATNTMFTDYSSPASTSWDGTPTEKGVTNIRDNDGIISFRFMKDRLRRPVLNEETEIGNDSFTANWQAVDDAESYRMNIREILPDSVNPVLLDESFDGMTEGSYPKSGNTDISASLDSYMSAAGWEGSEVYSCGGYVRIGGYGQSGSLVSPTLNLSGNDGKATLLFNAAGYPGKSVSFTVELTDKTTGRVTDSQTLKAGKNLKGYYLKLQGGTSACRLSITTKNERLFIDALRLVKGDVDSSMVGRLGPAEWTVDSISGTSYRVGSLVPGRTYRYTVEALAGESLCSSLPSEERSVTTLSTDGIASVPRSHKGGIVSITCHDLAGRRVTPSGKGVFIRTVRYADGTCVRTKIAGSATTGSLK